MYYLLFESKIFTILISLSVIILLSSLLGGGRLWIKAVMFIPPPAMAVAFFVIALFEDNNANKLDLISAIVFELSVLTIFIILLQKIRKDISAIHESSAINALKALVTVHIISVIPNIMVQGYGIFSDFNKLDYLNTNVISKYLTYLTILFNTLEAIFLSIVITYKGKLNIISWIVVLVNFIISVASGSKGVFFLWILMVLALIDYRKINLKYANIILYITSLVILLIISFITISEFIGIEIESLLELVLNRIFLTNDARALAFDMRKPPEYDYIFLVESFRSVSSLLGMSPKNDPLGILLYDQGLNIGGGIGANASYIALATYYSTEGYVLVPSLIGIAGLILIFIVDHLFRFVMKDSIERVIVSGCMSSVVLMYSQDFLGFQLILPLTILIFISIYIINITKFKVRYHN
jgi:hypothetical protein